VRKLAHDWTYSTSVKSLSFRSLFTCLPLRKSATDHGLRCSPKADVRRNHPPVQSCQKSWDGANSQTAQSPEATSPLPPKVAPDGRFSSPSQLTPLFPSL